ncbi:MAG TPA: four helix bundle protein [Thiolapillus brandeum]|uniref:Four helix bundle protein n=1 Tax=Thiolapillus brandeum TaxID=1076588 RepID=A0A831NRN2_9GAMM|nr:four helix bundle protein [Thiolapillus brandeum]
MTNEDKKYDLQERFIAFAVRVINLSESLPDSKSGNHVRSQILRSGTSPAPNYGEAQSAESRADFVHKLKLSLKELRETEVWLKIIAKAEMVKPVDKLLPLLKETDELISILCKSIQTVKKNQIDAKKIN